MKRRALIYGVGATGIRTAGAFRTFLEDKNALLNEDEHIHIQLLALDCCNHPGDYIREADQVEPVKGFPFREDEFFAFIPKGSDRQSLWRNIDELVQLGDKTARYFAQNAPPLGIASYTYPIEIEAGLFLDIDRFNKVTQSPLVDSLDKSEALDSHVDVFVFTSAFGMASTAAFPRLIENLLFNRPREFSLHMHTFLVDPNVYLSIWGLPQNQNLSLFHKTLRNSNRVRQLATENGVTLNQYLVQQNPHAMVVKKFESRGEILSRVVETVGAAYIDEQDPASEHLAVLNEELLRIKIEEIAPRL